MKEQGTIIKLIGTNPYGFIRRLDGSELFFHFSKYPRGQQPAEGDMLEYEVVTDPSKPGGKQNFADKITIVSKANTAPSASPTSNTTSRKSANGPLNVNVKFMFSQPEATDDEFSLLLNVVVTDIQNKPLQFAQVNVSTQYGEVAQNPYTRGDGEATLRVILLRPYDDAGTPLAPPLNIKNLFFTATIEHGGKSLIVTEAWPRKEMKEQAPPPAPTPAAPPASASLPAPTSTPQPDPEPDRLEVTAAGFPNAARLFEMNVTSFAADRKVAGKFAFTLSCAEALRVFEPDGTTSLGTGTEVSLETLGNGTRRFLIGFSSPVHTSVTCKLASGKGQPVQKLLVQPLKGTPWTSQK